MVWLPLGVGVVVGTFRSVAFGAFADPLLAFPFLLLACALAGVCVLLAIIHFVTFLARGRPIRAFCGPAFSLGAWLVAWFMIVGPGGDYIHLGVAFPSYLSSGELGGWRARPVEFNWETYQIALGGQGTRTLVYAPDGRIGGVGTSMPPIMNAATWRTIRPLVGGFILVTTIED